MKHSTFHSWLHPVWSPLLIAEICCLSLLWFFSLAVFLSIGIRDAETSYQYDGSSRIPTSLPFFAERESEYLNIDIRFNLNPLHATRYVIIPDDCIETLIINGREITEAKGLCLKRPGHLLHLPDLQAGENTVFLRLHDTGGQGGIGLRASFMDPLAFAILFLLVAIGLWISMRIIRASGGRWEATVIPLIMMLGFFIRLTLADHGGFGGDIHLNKEWSRSAVQIGIVESYNRQVNPEVMLPNYPPLNILMFAATGYIYKYTISPDFDPNLPIFTIIIKLAAITADLLMIVIVYLLLISMGGRKKALLVSLLYALHPAVIHDSSIWGQTDGVFTLFMCLSLLFVQRNQWIFVGCSIMAALLFKMQAIMILPVLAIAAGLHWRRWLKMFAGGAVVITPVAMPFLINGALDKIINVYLHSVGFYSSLSSSAYNLWVMLYGRETGKSGTDLFMNIIEHRTLGLILWMIVIVSVTFGWMSAIRHDVKEKGKKGILMLSASLIAYAFFLFNAEMHERYLFPYMAFGLPLILLGRKGVILYLSASFLFLLNLTSLVAFTDVDRILLQETIGKALPVAVATANVIVFFITWRFLHLYQYSTLKSRPVNALFLSICHWIWVKPAKAIRRKLLRHMILR